MAYLFLSAIFATLLGYGVPFITLLAPYFFYKAFANDISSLKDNPFFFSLLIFTLWLLVVTLYHNNFLGLLAGAYAILPTVFLFLYAGKVLDQEKAFKFLNVLIMLSLFSVPVAFYQQYILQVSVFERAYGTFGNANFYASYLLMIIPACVGLVIYTSDKKYKLFYISAALINSYCLYLTNSRSAIVALLLSFIFFGAISKNTRLIKITGILVLIIAITVIINPSFIPRYEIIIEEFEERISIWSLGWYAITQHPIIGTGLTSFYTKYVMNYPGKYAPHAHNLFLNIWVEGGLIGLGLLLWNLIKTYQIGLKKFFASRNILVLGILTGVTAVLLHSFMDNPLENFQTGTIFAFYVIILLRL